MKQLTVVVKPFRAEAVLRAIADLDVSSCVVREAKGYSRQKGYLDRYAGSEYSMAFLPKVEIIVSVAADRAEEVADRIVRAPAPAASATAKSSCCPPAGRGRWSSDAAVTASAYPRANACGDGRKRPSRPRRSGPTPLPS